MKEFIELIREDIVGCLITISQPDLTDAFKVKEVDKYLMETLNKLYSKISDFDRQELYENAATDMLKELEPNSGIMHVTHITDGSVEIEYHVYDHDYSGGIGVKSFSVEEIEKYLLRKKFVKS